jgi:hypothetical protein
MTATLVGATKGTKKEPTAEEEAARPARPRPAPAPCQAAPPPHRSPPPCANLYADRLRSSPLPPAKTPSVTKTWQTAAGIPDSRPASARASLDPRHGENPQSWHIVGKPGPRASSSLSSQPREIPRRYDPSRNAARQSSIRLDMAQDGADLRGRPGSWGRQPAGKTRTAAQGPRRPGGELASRRWCGSGRCGRLIGPLRCGWTGV